MPIFRANSTLKDPRLLKPTSRHTSVTEWPRASSLCAAVSLSRVRNWSGVSPNTASNLRMKWNEDRLASRATSLIETFEDRTSESRSRARQSWRKARRLGRAFDLTLLLLDLADAHRRASSGAPIGACTDPYLPMYRSQPSPMARIRRLASAGDHAATYLRRFAKGRLLTCLSQLFAGCCSRRLCNSTRKINA